MGIVFSCRRSFAAVILTPSRRIGKGAGRTRGGGLLGCEDPGRVLAQERYFAMASVVELREEPGGKRRDRSLGSPVS